MKKTFLSIGLVLVVVTFLGWGFIALLQNAHAVSQTYTCNTDGTFASSNTGAAQLTSTDTTKAALADSWLQSMVGTDTTVTTNSTIAPSVDEPSAYTGSINGTFNLQGASYSIDDTSVIRNVSPSTVPDSYRGVITGHVTMTPSPFRWIIQAYKDNGGVVTQVPVQAAADGTTGDFSIDLTGVSASYTGKWMLGVLDANASYAPYGPMWPTPTTYHGLEVQQLLVTDAIYFWSSVPANTDGTFSFPNSNTGTKMFRLVDTTTHDVLAEYFKPTGLLRSYQYQPGDTGYGTALQNVSYVYDQSMALFAAISQHNGAQAKLFVDGLLQFQTQTGAHSGGFVFAAPQLSPTYTDNYYRTGADAIATDALLAYIQTYPSDANIVAYKAAAVSALTFMQTTLSSSGATSGLYLGGFGNYSGSPQTFDPNYSVTWASTEHNIDTWQMLTRASAVLGNSVVNYQQKADNLSAAIYTKLFNTSLQRFNQGINGGVPDTADPLDVSSWGAIQLYAAGHVNEASQAIAHLPTFAITKNAVNGYEPYYDSAGYPGAISTLWFEGSLGVALAQYKVGNYDAYRTLLNSLASAQNVDGSFKYATDTDTNYGMVTNKSVASTAWFIMATSGRNVIWNSCIYNPPAVDTTPGGTTTTGTSSDSATGSKPIAATDTANSTTPDVTPATTPTDTSPSTTDSTTKAATSSDNKKSSYNWVPWMIGGGVILVIVIIILVSRLLL